MIAIPFEEAKFAGDSEFYVDGTEQQVVYDDGDTFESLVAKFNALRYNGLSGEELEFEQECAVEPVGFWVVTEKSFDVACAVWPEGGCSNDSQTYLCNSAAKRVLAKLAVAEITP